MSELNKIFPKKTISIEQVNMNNLCFIDDLLVFSDKYAVTDSNVEIYQQALENVSLFYNYNTGNTYEYNVLLNEVGTIITGPDRLGTELTGVTEDTVLVFVNGRLLNKSEYSILDDKSIAILFNIPQLCLQQVFVYVAYKALTYQLLPVHTSSLEYLDVNRYDDNSSLLFVNGKKIDKQFIEVARKITNVNGTPIESTQLKVNFPLKASDTVELYSLDKNNTESVHFASTLGYTIFGPEDSYGNSLPKVYNTLISFDSIARLAIDNLREGMIFSDKDDIFKIIVVDDDFESNYIKCFSENSYFPKYSYGPGEYYIESPDLKSIVDYLSDFDKKNRIFIPEILSVFQNTILKEVYDSIIRLKSIRNISKVDSDHINKLIKLLGVNLNIKDLNLKQRHEFLEELNEFYRIAGTRDSYDIINVIQDNIKLIDMKQLFTPIHNTIPVSEQAIKYVTYSYNILNAGSGYDVGNKVYFSFYDAADNSNIIFNFTVSEVYESGDPQYSSNPKGIKALTPEIYDGKPYEALSSAFDLTPVDLNLKTDLTTIYVNYVYNYSIDSESGYFVNDELYDSNGTYKLKVTSVNSSGKITGWTITKGEQSGSIPLTVSNLPLYKSEPINCRLKITSSERSRSQILSDYTVNQKKSIYLEAGDYIVTLHGAAGGGGSAFKEHTGGANSYSGYTGQTTTNRFTLNQNTVFEYIIGSGGTGGYTWNYAATSGSGGYGYVNGNSGINAWAGSHDHHEASSAAGGGGAATGIKSIDGSIQYIAAGGNGGNADAWRWHGGSGSSTGGTGGYGGYTGSGTGEGGAASWKGTAGTGSGGYISITRIFYNYSGSLTGSLDNIHVNDVLTTLDNSFTATVTSISGSTATLSISPNNGNINIDKTYDIRKQTPVAQNAMLNISSTLDTTTHSIGDLTGNYPSLYVGAQLTATTTDTSVPSFTATGTVVSKNSKTGTVRVNWTLPNVKYDSYVKSPMNVSVKNGTGARIKVELHETQSEVIREYVDFFTIEDLGGKVRRGIMKPEIDYGRITEGTPSSPNPRVPGLPDYDYGMAINEDPQHIDADYGLITDDISGIFVKWWEWDRPKDYYPTNHVNIEIKMESTEEEEDLRNKFIDQFYNTASTVLYIHSIACSYFFGSSTVDTTHGVIDPSTNTVFLGLQTGQPIDFQTVVLTSDPARQISTNNLD